MKEVNGLIFSGWDLAAVFDPKDWKTMSVAKHNKTIKEATDKFYGDQDYKEMSIILMEDKEDVFILSRIKEER